MERLKMSDEHIPATTTFMVNGEKINKASTLLSVES
jgi:hypothetical protein